MGLPKPMGQAGWAGQLPKACRAQAQGPLTTDLLLNPPLSG
jgi:hypothetical protein